MQTRCEDPGSISVRMNEYRHMLSQSIGGVKPWKMLAAYSANVYMYWDGGRSLGTEILSAVSVKSHTTAKNP